MMHGHKNAYLIQPLLILALHRLSLTEDLSVRRHDAILGWICLDHLQQGVGVA